MDYKGHKNLTLLNGTTIEAIEQKFPWFLEANTKDAGIEIKKDVFVWKNGIWKIGIWECGIWQDGIWWEGVWRDGTWKGGIWEGGVWKGGDWQKGYINSQTAPNNY